MKLSEAAQKGLTRIRRPMWSEQTYAKITVANGMCGPWMSLYSRAVQEAIDEPTPQRTLCIGDPTDDYEEYTGELDSKDK